MRRDGDGDGARDVARPAYEDAYEDAVAALERAMARRARAALEGDDGGTTAREWTPEDGAEAAARVLETCGAHYTAWAFRMRCVEDAVDAREAEAGTATLRDELAFAEAQTTKNPKNYQVWNHARMVLERADAAGAFEGLRDGAFAHANAALMLDGKNIHAWSHRAWLVERCDAWEEEMAFTEEMLAEDWMNNSAWNARFQCVTVCLERGDVGVLEREAAFATTAPRVDDDNESAWNYLRGLCAIAERDGSAIPRDVANRVVALAIDAAHDLGFIAGDEDLPADLPAVGANEAVAVFAGGCFWCMTAPFETLDGVRAVTSGFIGGDVARPRYRDVGSGKTGHVESVRVVYDAAKTSYEKLLSVYWRQIDATRDDGQFVDAGKQYRPVIWAMDDAQKRAAEKSKEELERANVFGAPIKVEVVDASGMTFWPAERYHQDYYLKNPNRYRFYRAVSGRDEYIASVWGIERSS